MGFLVVLLLTGFMRQPVVAQELKAENKNTEEPVQKIENLDAIGFEEVKEAGRSRETALEVPYPCRVRGIMDKGDFDVYKVNFSGGMMKVVSKGPLDLVVDLKDASGVVLARAGQDAAVDFVLEKQLPPGAYYLNVRVMYHLAAGGYELLLGNVDGHTSVVQEGTLTQ
jgi:hypothetical protein